MRQPLCWCVVMMALLAAPAGAQAPVELTLDEAVRRALEEAPRLAEARAREAAAEATVASRQAIGRPSLTVFAGVLRTNRVEEFGVPQAGGGTRIIFPDLPNNYRTRAELSAPLFTAGRVDALVTAARAETRAAAADRRAPAAEIELAATSAYWALVTARERTSVLERALSRAESALAEVGARVDSGLLPPNERLSAQAQRARQRVQLVRAQHDAAVAEADLARLIGLDPGAAIVASTPVSQPSSAARELEARPETELLAQAGAARPERLALEARRGALEASAGAARAESRPQVFAFAAVQPARPNPLFVPRIDEWRTGWDLGVTVNWSVWDGGRTRADEKAALAQARAAAARLEEFDALVAVEVRQRLLDLASARTALEASDDAVQAAAEARRVIGERFTVGVATSTEVLDADVALLEAELERTQLLAALRVSEARLVRTVGSDRP
jgi:outer membrane protein TolC